MIERLSNANIDHPTPIQSRVIPHALSGKSLVATSNTGSGKTLAYLLPIVQMIEQNSALRALILAPTRELAQQIGAVCATITDPAISCAVIVGGVEYTPQRKALERNPHIIVSTPGRLLDLKAQGVEIPTPTHFVLDEVDQMLDLGFRDPIKEIASWRTSSTQTICLSATLPSDVDELLTEISPASERVEVEGESKSVDTIEMLGYYVMPAMMDMLLLHLLRREQCDQAIIFARSRKMADRLTTLLADNGFTAEAMHSDRSQRAREYIIERFRSRETRIMVATDVVARGIDIESVSHIFNYGLPLNAEQFLHRIGRCGRAGRSGRALSLIDPKEKAMVDNICRMIRRHMIIDHSHPYITPEVARSLESTNQQKKGKRRK